MKVGFISLGCAKNQVNCEQMIWKTYEAGYEVALGAEDCDVAVVNTCGFLQEAREEALCPPPVRRPSTIFWRWRS